MSHPSSKSGGTESCPRVAHPDGTSWTAFDRGIRLATQHGRTANLGRWINGRDKIYRQIMSRGWNEKRSAFVQYYATDVLDASVLRMGQVGLIAPTDPQWTSTLRAMEDELISDSLLYRYNPEASPDGLRGSEGTFSLCTFWYVESLAKAGRLEAARQTFEKMFTYANRLGLYGEEIGLTGEQLGNFPQAFTHPALINAALPLNDALDLDPHLTIDAPVAIPSAANSSPLFASEPVIQAGSYLSC